MGDLDDASSFALAFIDTTINMATGMGVVSDGWSAVPEHVTRTEIENVVGSRYHDTITGSADGNLLRVKWAARTT